MLDMSIPCGLVVRIRGFHPRGPGSIPGTGDLQFVFDFYQYYKHDDIRFIHLDNLVTFQLGEGVDQNERHMIVQTPHIKHLLQMHMTPLKFE